MGTWGTGIYQDDLTCEIKEEYLNRLRVGMSNQEATKDLFEYNDEFLCSDEDYGIFTIALADVQWKYGKLLPEIKEAAIKYINSEIDYARWSNEKTLKKRKQILSELAMRLNSTPPPEKKIQQLKLEKRKWNNDDIIIYKLSNREFEKTKWHNKYIAFKVIGYTKLRVGGLPEEYFHEYNIVEFYEYCWKKKPTLADIEKTKIYSGKDYILSLNSKEIQQLSMEKLDRQTQETVDKEISLLRIPIITSGNVNYIVKSIVMSLDTIER